MVKVALSSDQHLDINQVPVETMISQQAAWLLQQQVGIYLVAGDLFNHFDRSLAFMQQLQAAVPTIQVRFIAGNHDMVNGVTFDELEQPLDPTYLHNQFFDVPGTDWRIIGNNGWYDYTFADGLDKDVAAFEQWKRAYWLDSAIQQPMTDPERTDLVLEQVTAQLKRAQVDQKRVFFMTHFVPQSTYLRITDDNRFWNMANAMMGSQRLGNLLTQFKVDRVLFGHMHLRTQPRLIDGTTYYNQAVGYGTKRRHEWQSDSFLTEWQRQLRIVELDSSNLKS
ncbi:metallophosphoesterase [Secundilactobacillus muriivasis]